MFYSRWVTLLVITRLDLDWTITIIETCLMSFYSFQMNSKTKDEDSFYLCIQYLNIWFALFFSGIHVEHHWHLLTILQCRWHTLTYERVAVQEARETIFIGHLVLGKYVQEKQVAETKYYGEEKRVCLYVDRLNLSSEATLLGKYNVLWNRMTSEEWGHSLRETNNSLVLIIVTAK